MINAKNLVKHELIGLKSKVLASKNKDSTKLSGKIIDETQKTIVLNTGKKQVRVFKSNSTFRFTLPHNQQIDIDGHLLLGRPWERIKARLR